jgi:hypothetical protein
MKDTTSLMRDLEARFQAQTGLSSRSQYKIFYCQIRPAWLLTLGINPGGAPSETASDGGSHTAGRRTGQAAASSVSYFENNEHDILDCDWTENPGLRKLLAPLLDGDLGRVRNEVVKTNMAFRRSAKISQIQREQSFDESAPILSEIIRVVRPRLILLTGPTVTSFLERYAKAATMVVPAERKDSINQTVFAAARATLRATGDKALIVQVAHASQWSATYGEFNVAQRIRLLMDA